MLPRFLCNSIDNKEFPVKETAEMDPFWIHFSALKPLDWTPSWAEGKLIGEINWCVQKDRRQQFCEKEGGLYNTGHREQLRAGASFSD